MSRIETAVDVYEKISTGNDLVAMWDAATDREKSIIALSMFVGIAGVLCSSMQLQEQKMSNFQNQTGFWGHKRGSGVRSCINTFSC